MQQIDVGVIGAGQAGLAVSHELTGLGVEHVVLERGRVAETWRNRWDSFCLEPISKPFEEDHETCKLDKAEEIEGVVLPANEDPALPLNPGEEALNEPASHVAAWPSPIFAGRLASVAPMRRDHLDAVLSQLRIQRIAVIGTIADQVFRLGLDHVEVET